jgi:hypothetical protein
MRHVMMLFSLQCLFIPASSHADSSILGIDNDLDTQHMVLTALVGSIKAPSEASRRGA